MKKSFFTPLILIAILSVTSRAQLNPDEKLIRSSTHFTSASAMGNEYLERVGSFPYGPAISIVVDSIRNLIFVSSGGAALILDGSNPANLQLLTDSLRTDGLVYDLAYDAATQRLYFACGYGGFEIWNVQNPYQPFRYSNFPVLYFDVPTPVGRVQIRNNIAVVECAWGFVRSINVTDPYNPFQVDVEITMGNPAHRIYVEPYEFVHTTGYDGYFRFYMDAAGYFSLAGGRYFSYGGAYEVFGTHSLAFVGFGNAVYILDLNIGTFPVLSAINVNGNSHIEARNNLVYITNSDGLHIWNIADPANPFFVSTTATRNLSSDFVIAGNYLYAAERSSGFDIVDISDPENPFIAGSYEALNETRDVWVDGNYAYLSHVDDGVIITDISDIGYPVFAGQYDTPGYCYNLTVKDNLLFVTGLEDGLRIADVSDPANPVGLSNVSGFNAWRVEVAGNYAYVIGRIFNQTDNLRIFDISNPSNPIQLSLTPIPGITDGIVFYNNYLFLAAGEGGLRIVDVSDPYNPVTVNTLPLASNIESVTIRNNYAYVATLDIGGINDGFFILDISDPENPTEIGHYIDVALSPFDVEVSGDFAYLTNDHDLVAFLISDPTNPVYIESIKTPNLFFSEFAVDSLIFVADREAGLQIYKNIHFNDPGGGLQWQTQLAGTEAGFNSIFFTDLNNGWAAGYSGMLYNTTDGGFNWIEQQSGTTDDILSIYFSSSQTGWFVGTSGKIFNTQDGGNTWQPQTSGTSNDLFDISFADDMNGWAVGDEIILHTINGGSSWSSQSFPSGYFNGFISVDFVDLMNGWIADGGEIGTILKTSNGGNEWTFRSGLSEYPLIDVDFVNENVGYFVGVFGAILKTTDGGNTWITQPDPPPHDWLYGVHFLNEETGWAVGFNGKVIYTTNGGNPWEQQTSGTTVQLNSVYFIDQAHGWAAGEDQSSGSGVIIKYSTGIVPVELTLFTADVDDNNVTLLWQTSTETNNSGFEIQRGKDGDGSKDTGWERIGFVKGQGTTPVINNYSFTDENLSAGRYQYRLKQIDFDGSFKYSNTLDVNILAPKKFSLEQNYPNPFNPVTTITYGLPLKSQIELIIYNVLGEMVLQLADGVKEAGIHTVEFDATSAAGGLPSGVYFYRLRSGNFIQTKKMILLK
jgi:photosystem II stability/assembly factor-like uncharacterized protein